MQGLAAGGRPAHADEQPRPRGRRAARRPGGLRRHRQGRAQLGRLPRHRARAPAPRRRRDPAGAVRPRGRRVPHPRGRAPGAHRQLQPGAPLGHLGELPRARGRGPDHVRPDDRRLVDLHRHPGHPAGHLRDLRRRRRAPTTAPTRPGCGQAGALGRPRRHGRRPAAGGDHGRRRVPRRRGRSQPHRSAGSRPATSTSWRRDLDERAQPRSTQCAKAGEARSIGVVGNAADVYPSWSAAASPPTWSPTRPRPTIPLSGYVPGGLDPRGAPTSSGCATPTSTSRRARASMAVHCQAMLDLGAAGAHVFDYGNNLRGQAELGGLDGAFGYPGFVPAYIRPLFCEGKGPFRWAALSGDPDDIRATDEAVLELVTDDPALATWIAAGPGAGRVPGPAGAHLLAGLRRAGPGRAALQRAGQERQGQGAHRHRPRPPRLRLGRLAQPRDRGHEGRLRRHRRLAHPQRPGQHRGRRHLGELPPRRRRRHRLLAARRHGGRRRRHRPGRSAASSGCSPAIRAWASCATPTPATTRRSSTPTRPASPIPRRRMAD